MNFEFRKQSAVKFHFLTSFVAVFCPLVGLLLFAGPLDLKAQNSAADRPDKKSSDKKTRRRPRSSGPSLTPASPTVTPGNSITIVAGSPVTWTLTGVGTLSNQTSTSVTYTAPASVVPAHSMLGCPVLPNDTVFNTPIDNLPLDPNSSAMIATQVPSALAYQPSWGISYADNSTPVRTFLSFYDSVVHANFVFPNKGPNLKRESGDYVGLFSFTANRPDHHVMTVRRTDCTFWETYDDYTDGYLRTCNDGVTPNCNIQSATTYSSSSYNFTPSGWGTDAAGLLLAPLVWHLDEIKNGSINHAVRFTEGTGGILFNAIRWPASATAGGCGTCPNALPMGARLRLKAAFNTSTFSPTAQTMLNALKRYGMVLADSGTNNAIQTATDLWSDPTVSAALKELGAAAINISNFEVVDESSLQFAPDSYAVCPYNTTCMAGTNTYEQPVSQAMITATTSSGSSSSVPVALMGVSIGLGVPPVLPVQAGTYSFQIPFWVNNSSNQTVNWTLKSGVGSVTPAGVYTPPATTANSSTNSAAVLLGTSAADSNVTTTLYLTVLPAGANPNGSIRIDTGATANNTDSNGNVWLADTGAEGTDGAVAVDYPAWPTANLQRIVYQSAAIGYANDLRYTIVVPNGNYRVHLLFGVPYNGCPSPCGYYAGSFGQDTHTYNPQMIETQGVLQSHYFDFGFKVGYAFASPVDTYVPAKVTNNMLQLGVLALAPDSGPSLSPATSNKYNILNGVEILPDASAPHWTIDTQQQSSISAGQTLRPFYVTDWYTGVNDPVWTIVSGPVGASLNGSTLTLASGTYLNGQPIVVKASDGTYSATATITTTGGTRAPLGIVVAPAPVNHFGFKRAINIAHAHVSATQTNFPVEISVTDPSIESVSNGGHVQNENGYDIVITSDAAGSTRLNWEVERYDPVAGNWVGHVLIPSLSNSIDTTIYLFYGNPAISTDQSAPKLVWDSNFTGVYHMANITASTVGDSTALGNNATLNSQVVQVTNGQVGSAGLFPGTSTGGHFELPPTVLNASQGTVSAWLYTTIPAVVGQDWVTAAQIDSANQFHFAHWATSLASSIFGWVYQGTDYRIDLSNTVLPMPVGTWQYVAYTWNKTTNTQVVYLNGVAINTTTTPFTSYTPVANLWIGSESANPSYAFGGLMDEIRFSKISRSASWLTTEYANQSSPATFYTLGSETTN